MAKHGFEPLGRLDQFAKIEPGFKPSAFQHVDDIFGGDIARRRRCKRTSANSAATCIDDINAGLDGRSDIGEPGAARVMKVQAQVHVRGFHTHAFDDRSNIPRCGDADCVAEADFCCPSALGLRGEIGDDAWIDFPAIGVAKKQQRRWLRVEFLPRAPEARRSPACLHFAAASYADFARQSLLLRRARN